MIPEELRRASIRRRLFTNSSNEGEVDPVLLIGIVLMVTETALPDAKEFRRCDL